VRKLLEAGEHCIMRRFMLLRFTKYYSGNQVKENVIGGTCITHGRNKKSVQNFGRET
jgi:hypothetical protein